MKEIFSKTVGFFRRIFRPVKNFFASVAEWRREKAFSLTRGFFTYIVILVLALVATQALVSKITSVVFIFVLLCPLISLLHMYICTQTIGVEVSLSEEEVEKYTPVKFRVSLINSSFIPLSTLEARLTTPRGDGIRCEAKKINLTLPPFADYTVEDEILFPYRGQYDIGVSDIVCSDFFGMFRYTCNLNNFKSVFVLPRRINMIKPESDDRSETVTEITSRFSGSDKTEQNDVREYQVGDSLRSIHWKLSSKTQDLMVKQYSMNKEKRTYIFCDTAERYDRNDMNKYVPDINEFAVDGVVESAIAIATYILSKGGNVGVVWFDRRGYDSVCVQNADSSFEFNELYRMLATSDIISTDKTMADLDAAVDHDSDSTYIYISASPDPTLSALLCERIGDESDVRSVNRAKELYTYVPYEKITGKYLPEYKDMLDATLAEIRGSAIRVYDARAFENERQVPSV